MVLLLGQARGRALSPAEMVDAAQLSLNTKVFSQIREGFGLMRVPPVIGHDSQGLVRSGLIVDVKGWLDPHYWGAGLLVGCGTNPFRLDRSHVRWAFWMHSPSQAEWQKIVSTGSDRRPGIASRGTTMTDKVPLYVNGLDDAYRIEPAKLLAKLLTMKPSGSPSSLGRITLYAREVKISSETCLSCHTHSKMGDAVGWMVYAFAKKTS